MKRRIGALMVVCAVTFGWVSVNNALAQSCNVSSMQDGYEYWFWLWKKQGATSKTFKRGKLAIRKGSEIGGVYKASIFWAATGKREQGYTAERLGPSLVIKHAANKEVWMGTASSCYGSIIRGIRYPLKADGSAEYSAMKSFFDLDTSKKWPYRSK